MHVGVSSSLTVFLLVAIAPMALAAQPATTPTQVSFRRDIAPILVRQCQGCHGPEKTKSAYRLDTFTRLMIPGKNKAAPITPGHPDRSEIYRLITAKDEDDRMPKDGDPLKPAQAEAFRRWILAGAKFDSPDPAAPLASIIEDTEHPPAPVVYPRPTPITSIAFSPDGKTLAASGYHEISLWDPADGRLRGRIDRLAERTYALAYSPDGTHLAAACGSPGLLGEVLLIDLTTTPPALRTLDRIGDVMLAVRFSPDGKHLAAAGADNAIRLYSLPSAKRDLVIEQHADWVLDLFFSPDSTRIASASRDKSARVFDVKTGAMISSFLGHEEIVAAVAWSADGKHVYSAGRDHSVRVWTPADAKQTGQIKGLDADPLKLETSQGKLFVVCTAGGSLSAYADDDKHELLRHYAPTPDWTYCLAIDPKNHHLATGSHNGQIHLFNLDAAKPLRAFTAAPGFTPR
ncbi:MAG TPA: c-type cytochrome domain-containing protein [Tepidisphaeraceae bacterium]|jgi:WD40 repeat protein